MRKEVNSGILCLTIAIKKLVIRIRNDCILNIYLTSLFKHRFGNNITCFKTWSAVYWYLRC